MRDYNPRFVTGKNIDECWFNLLVDLCKNGRIYRIDAGSFAGEFRLEFDCCSGIIFNPISYNDAGVMLPLAPTVPEGCPAPTDDKKIYEYYRNYLLNSELADNEHYRYATFIVGGKYQIPRIRASAFPNEVPIISSNRAVPTEQLEPVIHVPDQLTWVVDHYNKKGLFNNHCMIQVGYPESQFAYEIPYKTETERHTSPCLRIIGCQITEEDKKYYLNLSVVFRSWDLYNGFPENMGGLALLMDYLSKLITVKTGKEVNTGSLNFFSWGLHVYSHAFSAFAMRCGNDEILERFKHIKEGV